MSTQTCPICGVAVRRNERYPRYVCAECEGMALSSDGHSLEMFNASLSGGFQAFIRDTGEKYDSNVCFIKGVACWADEGRFGGVVIQPIRPSEIRALFDQKRGRPTG